MPVEEGPAGLPAFLSDPIGVLRRRWLWMLVCAAVGAIAALAIVAIIPVMYQAHTTLLVTSQQIPERFVASTITEEAIDRMNALIGELLSRSRLIAILQKHNPYPEHSDSSVNELVERMREDITVQPESETSRQRGGSNSVILRISFRHSGSEMAAVVANDLASFFVVASSRLRSQQARIATEFMQNELNREEGELREIDRKIADLQARHRGELPSEVEANLAKLERLATERENLNMQIRANESQISLTLRAIDTESVSSPWARLQALQANLATEAVVHTDEHPNVVTLRRQVAALEAEIGRGGGIGAGDAVRQQSVEPQRRLIEEMKRRLARIDQAVHDLEGRVERAPQHQEALSALEERATVLRESYVDSLRKVKAAELAESLEVAQRGERVQVIDRALPPSEPEIRRAVYLIAGLTVSILLAAALAVLLELLDPVIVSRAQIEQEFGLPILGGVPEIG